MTLDEFISLSAAEREKLAGPAAASRRRQAQQVQRTSVQNNTQQDLAQQNPAQQAPAEQNLAREQMAAAVSSEAQPPQSVVELEAADDIDTAANDVEADAVDVTDVVADERPEPLAPVTEPQSPVAEVATAVEATVVEETEDDIRVVVEDAAVAPQAVVTQTVARSATRPAIVPMTEGTASPLNLDIFTAVRMAVDSHPSVAESIGRLYQQSERVSVARAGYLPTVRSGISTGYRDSLGRSTESFNFSVSQMVYDFGKVSNAVDMEEFGVQRDRAGVLRSIDNLARDTARAFIEVQRYQRLVELAGDQIDSIGEIQEMAEQRAQLGASTRSDEMQAQSREQSAMAMRQQLQAELDGWKRSLQNLVSMDRPIQVTDDFPQEMNAACEIAAEDYRNAPEVLMAEAELQEARASIEKARSDLFPTISLDLDYDNYFDESNNLNFPDIDEDVAISLSVNMDLFQGGAIRARKRSAEYALQAASAARANAMLGVSRRLLEAKDQTRSLSDRLRFLGNQLQNIVDTQELYRQQYLSLGTRTLLDILNTEQEIYQSRFDQENTIRDLQRLQVECMHSVASIRNAFGVNVEQVQGAGLNP